MPGIHLASNGIKLRELERLAHEAQRGVLRIWRSSLVGSAVISTVALYPGGRIVCNCRRGEDCADIKAVREVLAKTPAVPA